MGRGVGLVREQYVPVNTPSLGNLVSVDGDGALERPGGTRRQRLESHRLLDHALQVRALSIEELAAHFISMRGHHGALFFHQMPPLVRTQTKEEQSIRQRRSRRLRSGQNEQQRVFYNLLPRQLPVPAAADARRRRFFLAVAILLLCSLVGGIYHGTQRRFVRTVPLQLLHLLHDLARQVFLGPERPGSLGEHVEHHPQIGEAGDPLLDPGAEDGHLVIGEGQAEDLPPRHVQRVRRAGLLGVGVAAGQHAPDLPVGRGPQVGDGGSHGRRRHGRPDQPAHVGVPPPVRLGQQGVLVEDAAGLDAGLDPVGVELRVEEFLDIVSAADDGAGAAQEVHHPHAGIAEGAGHAVPEVSGAEGLGADEDLIAEQGTAEPAGGQRGVGGGVLDDVGIKYAFEIEGESDSYGGAEKNDLADDGRNCGQGRHRFGYCRYWRQGKGGRRGGRIRWRTGQLAGLVPRGPARTRLMANMTNVSMMCRCAAKLPLRDGHERIYWRWHASARRQGDGGNA
mmetsp:Transcript_4469/g.10698  ORF Transcript_4469/g.10698 Transcript_4469/m.10698 type:complete len:508 (+) Transcript_4469:440-1963(+)